MADIIGQSGSWKFLSEKMEALGYTISSVDDFSTILAKEKGRLLNESARKDEFLQQENEMFSLKMKTLDGHYQKAVLSAKANSGKKIKIISSRIEHLQQPVSLFRKIKRHFQISREKRNLKKIKMQGQEVFKRLRQQMSLEQEKLKLEHEKRRKHINNRAGKLAHKIEEIKKISESRVLFGALAEMELAQHLSQLPDDYYVLNDVNLELMKAIHFDEKWRRTAQIDILVISASGIFVVEVKNWSKKFIDSENYHNPYDQVKWAAYLCYTLTNVKTRSIIAHTGYIPPKPEGSYAKVLHLNEVRNHILWFKDSLLTKSQIKTLVDELSAF